MPEPALSAGLERRRLEVPGAHLSYAVCGPRDGRALVLCHGLAANGRQFLSDARFFAAHGFRVLVPDLRGHGHSRLTGPAEATEFSIARMAADMVAMLDAEGLDRAHWVGNSLGGILALWLMGSAPERLGRVVTFGTAYSLDVPQLVVPAMRLVHGVMGTRLLARIGAPLTCRGPRGAALVRRMLRDIDPPAVLAAARAVRHYDLIANALGFDRPILMIRGKLDQSVNLALKPTLAAMRGRPGFTLLDLHGAGHCANLDRPHEVRKAILDFLG